jgi:hypothetical protein
MGERYRGKMALSGYKSPRKESGQYLPTKFAIGLSEDGPSQCMLYCDPGGEFAHWLQIDSITLTSIMCRSHACRLCTTAKFYIAIYSLGTVLLV